MRDEKRIGRKEKLNYTEECAFSRPYRESLNEQIEGFVASRQSAAEARRQKNFSARYPAQKEQLREEYVKMLGFPLDRYGELPAGGWTQKTLVTECYDCRVYRVRYAVVDGLEGYGLFFEPLEKKSEKTPLVLCCHGGSGTPEVVASFVMDSANYHHMVRRALSYGVAAFAPQLYMWNKEIYGPDYDREKVANALTQLDGSMTALEVTLIRKGLDAALAGEEWLDPDRIGFVGLSYGGMYAIATAACDPRIRAVYSSCQFNDRAKINWTDWSYRGAAETFFDAETAALIAPRALFLEVADKDEIFPPEGAQRAFETLKTYYEKAGADALCFRVFPGGHELAQDDAGYAFLMKHLSVK